MRTKIKLSLGQGRMDEEDVIFDRKVETIAGNAEGLWLEEGTQRWGCCPSCSLCSLSRFAFTIIIPSTLAPHDWHHNGDIRHRLYGEIEGIPDSSSSSSALFSVRPHATSANGRRFSATVKARSRSGSPHPNSPLLTPDITTSSMVITRQEAGLPQAPAYEESPDGDWLKGSYEAERTIMLFYNPDPAGGVTQLDERATGHIPGLGGYELRLLSNVVSPGGNEAGNTG